MKNPVAPSHRMVALCCRVLFAVVALGTLVPAQRGGGVAGADAADAVVSAYEAVQKSSEAARLKVLKKMAKVVDSRVAKILEQELGRARGPEHQEGVLKVMGGAPRPKLVAPIYAVVVHANTTSKVRQAGAVSLGAQGHRGIDALSDLAEDPPGSVPSGHRGALRGSCLRALAAAADDRAWRALAALSLDGTDGERLEVVRLLGKAPSSTLVTRVRKDAARSGNPSLAAVALDQLVQAGASGVGRLVEDVLERLPLEKLADDVGAGLTSAVTGVLSDALYEELLMVSSGQGRQTRGALRKAGPQATKDAGFVRFLVEEGLRASERERDAARAWLKYADKEVARSELAQLRDELRSVRVDDLETIKMLHPVFATDPTWVEELLRVAKSKPWELRSTGLALLADIGAKAGLAEAHHNFDHDTWQVRSAAYSFCGTVRDLTSIPRLIRRLDEESGRLREDLLDALQDLTGRRYLQSNRWERFWEEDGEGFVMPPPRKRDRAGAADTTTQGFFNIPVVSDRVAFVIDVSGSMSAKIGTGGNRTRLSEAKRQLTIAVGALAAARYFNVIVYGSNVNPLRDRLVEATDHNKAELTAEVKALKLTGATNTYGGMKEAFEDPDVDTVFLLTDGDPSAGLITEPMELADEIARWNLTRQVVIHTICIGADRKMMRRLAAESGGSYVHVK